MKRLLIALTALVAAVVPAVGLVAVRQAPVDWNRNLAACASYTDSGELQRCARDSWLQAFRTGELTAYYAQLDIWTRQVPALSVACHDAGHEAGRKALTDVGEGAGIVVNGGTPTGACNNGFLHGVLDEMAHRDSDRGDYDAVIAACETTNGLIRFACLDGIGHSAWLVGRGERFAVETCLTFRDPAEQASCTGSIVMQMYRDDPFTGERSYLDKDRPDEEIPVLCERLASLGATDPMVIECWREGATPITEAAMLAAETAENDEGLAPAERIRRGVVAWRAGYDRCTGFGARAVMCQEKVADAVTWSVGDDEVRKQQLCLAFPAPHQARCRDNDTRRPLMEFTSR